MTTADPKDHARIKALFGEVCDLPTKESRHERLLALGASPDECTRVMALLAHDDGHTTRFSGPVAHMAHSAAGGELSAGERLGPWRLLRELGRGGMGLVFEAERCDGHYEQRVAIKLLRGFSNPAALEQLARERQLLASLNHPNIARLLDGGTTPAGHPFLVMEYVHGVRIDQHLAHQRLDEAAMLDLFLMVCDAVAHAHRQLVIHCDIKPGNVLVGSDGRAMLLDFGIAQLEGRAEGTARGLTPRYASPEQVAGAVPTAASDVYGLGRLLENLLGELGTVRRTDEWHAVVTKATASEPSQRYADVPALVQDLRRLRAYRPLEAMRARPHYPTYVAARYLGRNWPWLGVGTLGLAISLGFTWRLVQERDRAVAAEQMADTARATAESSGREATHQRALADQAAEQARGERDSAQEARTRAESEQRKADAQRQLADGERQKADAARQQAVREAALTRQVSELLVSLFDSADPFQGGRPDARAADLVDRGRDRLKAATHLPPEVRASMSAVLGRVYENLGNDMRSIELYEESVALEQTLRSARPLSEADTLSRLAIQVTNIGQFAKSIPLARRSLALRQAQLPADALEVGDAHNTLGYALIFADQRDEAQAQLLRALEIRKAHLGGEHVDVAVTLYNLAALANERGHFREAERIQRESLAIKLKRLDPSHPEVLVSQGHLATVLNQQMRYEEALGLMDDLLGKRRRLLGNDNSLVASALHTISRIQRNRGEGRVAADSAAEAMAINLRLGNTSRAEINELALAIALSDLGDPGAEAHFRSSLAHSLKRLPAGHTGIARAQQALGQWLVDQGRLQEAMPLLQASLDTYQARSPAHDGARLLAQGLMAEVAVLSGDLESAGRLLSTLAPREGTSGSSDRVRQDRIAALLASARRDLSAAIRHQQAALAEDGKSRPAQHPHGLQLRIELAELLAKVPDADAVADLLRQCAPLLERQHPESRLRRRALDLRARFPEAPGPAERSPGLRPQTTSATISMAPQGHSAMQMPQPLQ